jgi:hypothetical protein
MSRMDPDRNTCDRLASVRIGCSLPFDLRIRRDELFVPSQFVDGNTVLRHAHNVSLARAGLVLIPLNSTGSFLTQFNVRAATRACR